MYYVYVEDINLVVYCICMFEVGDVTYYNKFIKNVKRYIVCTNPFAQNK